LYKNFQNEAEAEEKESRFLQEKQLQNLADEDFLFDVFEKKKKTSTKAAANKSKTEDKDLESVKLDLSKLSRREKVRLLLWVRIAARTLILSLVFSLQCCAVILDLLCTVVVCT
jgi:hypothetical protein